MKMNKYLMFFIVFTWILTPTAFTALPANFVVSKLVKTRSNIQSLRVDLSTLLFNDEDPKSNLVFDESIIIKDFNQVMISVQVPKDKISSYGIDSIVKINQSEKEILVARNYQTIEVKHPVTDLLFLLFSNNGNDFSRILGNAKIDLEIIGLGRLSGVISRIYGAKEHNTYRKSGPSILSEDKGNFLVEASFYNNLKPQIWFNKDTFYITRFISRRDINNSELVSDIHFNEYRVFAETHMFPRVIDVLHNERLYARSIIKKMWVNPKIKKNLFRISNKYKKITYSKMINNLSESGLRILNYLRYYR